MSAHLAAESVSEGGCTASWSAMGGAGWWCASRGLTVVERHTAATVAEVKRLALEWLEEECRAQAVRAIAAATRVKALRVGP